MNDEQATGSRVEKKERPPNNSSGEQCFAQNGAHKHTRKMLLLLLWSDQDRKSVRWGILQLLLLLLLVGDKILNYVFIII